MRQSLIQYRPLAGRPALRPVGAAIAGLDVAVAWAIVVAISLMVGVVGLQVLLRYVFNDSLSWADELSRLAFVWSIFMGIALGLRVNAHIGIAALTNRLPARPRLQLARLVAAAGAGLMALVCWQSVRIAWEQWDELMGAVNMSTGWFMLAVAFGAGHSLLHLAWVAVHGPYGEQLEDVPGATP